MAAKFLEATSWRPKIHAVIVGLLTWLSIIQAARLKFTKRHYLRKLKYSARLATSSGREKRRSPTTPIANTLRRNLRRNSAKSEVGGEKERERPAAALKQANSLDESTPLNDGERFDARLSAYLQLRPPTRNYLFCDKFTQKSSWELKRKRVKVLNFFILKIAANQQVARMPPPTATTPTHALLRICRQQQQQQQQRRRRVTTTATYSILRYSALRNAFIIYFALFAFSLKCAVLICDAFTIRDMIRVTGKRTTTMETPICPTWHPFQCPNGDCIPIKYLCDGSPDCSDEYDEDKRMCTAAVRPPVEETASFLKALLNAHGADFLAKLFGVKAKDEMRAMGGVDKVAVAISQSPTIETFGAEMGLQSADVERLSVLLEAIISGEASDLTPDEAGDFRFFVQKLRETGFF